jgi:hypothetical protein
MKKIFLLAALIIVLQNSQGQQQKISSKPSKSPKIPELVTQAFSKQFPTIKKVKWSVEKSGEYEVEFNFSKAETSVLFDEKGTILEVETEISKKELPETIKTSLKTDFAEYKIGEVEKVVTNGVTTYEMEAKKGKDKFDLIFDTNGKFLKKEVDKDND